MKHADFQESSLAGGQRSAGPEDPEEGPRTDRIRSRADEEEEISPASFCLPPTRRAGRRAGCAEKTCAPSRA
jgi:hypothetical protein